MTANEVREKYLKFFEKRGHKVIPSAPLVPENDPTTLFTGSGMQPMVPYLLGEMHPLGTRLVDSQKCFRTQDIDEVGDNRHDSFFEMLGNWSLGDYFKTEQISWIFQFLTDKDEGLGLDPARIYITVFRGMPELNISRDEEAVTLWQERFEAFGLDNKVVDFPEEKGLQGGRIFYYDEKKNWWSRSGIPANMPVGEPGGPSSEMFYDFGADLKLRENSPFKDNPCHPNCDCGRFTEIGNNVFMTYLKSESGFVPLDKKNIDFGGGLERLSSAVNNDPDIFKTTLFISIIAVIEETVKRKYDDTVRQPSMRIIADHLKAATFLIADGVIPSNKAQGYFLRRLLRRAMVKMQKMTESTFTEENNLIYNQITDVVINSYNSHYPELSEKREYIQEIISEECNRFAKSISKGLKEFNQLKIVDGKAAFDLFQTYGFPLEITQELSEQRGQQIDREEYRKEFEKHQELSRTSSIGMFKGGLADQSEQTTKYHTATHLLHKALRTVLGDHVQQKGSNITAERLRFDFSHSQKLADEEIRKVEDMINEQIEKNLPVSSETKTYNEALAEGALAFFGEKYGEKVKVYTVGDPNGDWFSKEVCGGPHVSHTGEIGHVTISKQEKVGSGIMRIYAKTQ